MRAVILAAGKGSRLGKITEKKPKALVNVNGRPILQWQIDSLLKAGVKEIVVCTSHMSEQIVEFCNVAYPSQRIIFSNEEFPVNNLFSLYNAREYLEGNTMVMNGDVVFEDGIISVLANSQKSIIPAEKGMYNDESMKITVNLQNKVTGISKEIKGGYGCSIDLYCFNSEDTQILRQELIEMVESKGIRNAWTEVALMNLFQSGRISPEVFDISGKKWYEIDNVEDLYNAELMFNEKLDELSKKSVFLFDKDGTLSLGGKLIDGTGELMGFLKSKGKEAKVMTNNSSKTPQNHLDFFREKGLEFDLGNILVPTDSLIDYLKSHGKSRILLIANKSVGDYFREKGLEPVSNNPEAVILTYDDEIDYNKIASAHKFISQGVPYYATHTDSVCPTENGHVPDIGSFIKLFHHSTGRKPEKTFGKPSSEMLSGIEKENAVIVGDRLYTDIKLASEQGILSVLVLSGETKREDVESSEVKPDIIVNNINELSQFI